MKTSLSTQRERGLTLVELFVVMVIIAVFAAMIIPASTLNKARAYRIQCVNNLKQTGLAFRLWEPNGDKYPMKTSETNGGTMEFTSGLNAWRHFQVMSNELSTPKVIICPSEESRMPATNFTFLANSNVSYFVGIDATETDPQGFLSGDRNLTNGTPIKNGILEVSSNQPAGWTAEMHNKVGNILLSDGSLQQVSTTGLRSGIENTSLATNRLQMPVDP
jgi:prepilin-type N-terminal cleavage/methylation domain-containing protein